MNPNKFTEDIINILLPDNFYSDLSLDGNALRFCESQILLDNYKSISIIGIGKTAPKEVISLLNRLDSGNINIQFPSLVFTKWQHSIDDPRIKCIESSHPYLDASSIEAGKQLMEYIQNLAPSTLVVLCLSGGASALVEQLKENVDSDEYFKVARNLIHSEIDIVDINFIRRHLSNIKNGGLLRVRPDLDWLA
ncbi:MAG: DUF4147 domain-containing protein [Bdellovibrionales bacterium]